MEHKQTLWIISAAGVFLLVVIGAALIFYSPSATVTSRGPKELTYSPPAPVVPAPESISTPAATTPVGVTPSTPLVAETENKGITLQEDQYKALLDALAAAAARKDVPAAAPVPSVTALSSKAREAAAPKPAAVKPAAPKPESRATTDVAVKPAASNQYWIQAGSFASKNKADSARVELESAKIPVEVFTHTVSNGTIMYRVRVGPYTSESEAAYWQTQIGQIKNFEGTQTLVVKS